MIRMTLARLEPGMLIAEVDSDNPADYAEENMEWQLVVRKANRRDAKTMVETRSQDGEEAVQTGQSSQVVWVKTDMAGFIVKQEV